MVGMVMLLGVGFQTLLQKSRAVGVGVVVLILFACGDRTVVRNADWESNFTLFASAVEAVPRSAKAHFNLGHEMHDRGNWQEALDAAQRALAADPELYDAMEVVAKSHLQLGNRTAAIEWYERYIDTFSDQNDRDGYPQILRSFVEWLRTQ